MVKRYETPEFDISFTSSQSPEYVRADLLEAAEKRELEMVRTVQSLTEAAHKFAERIKEAEAERDQALAHLTTVQRETIERCASMAKRLLTADDYYSANDVEFQIRSIPLDTDAEADLARIVDERTKELREALEAGKGFAEDWINENGGIDAIDETDRSAFENMCAALSRTSGKDQNNDE